jgi:hypothetical protein
MIPEAFMRLLEKIETGQPLTVQEEQRYRKLLKNKEIKQFMKERELLEQQLESLPTPELDERFVDRLMPQITQEMESRFLVSGFPGMQSEGAKEKRATKRTNRTLLKRWFGAGIAFAAVVAFAIMIYPQIEREAELAPVVDGDNTKNKNHTITLNRATDEKHQTRSTEEAAQDSQASANQSRQAVNSSANEADESRAEEYDTVINFSSDSSVSNNQSTPGQAPLVQPAPAPQPAPKTPAKEQNSAINSPVEEPIIQVEPQTESATQPFDPSTKKTQMLNVQDSNQLMMTAQVYNVEIENQRVVIRNSNGAIVYQSAQKAKSGVQSIQLVGWQTNGDVYRYQVVSAIGKQTYDVNVQTGTETKVKP